MKKISIILAIGLVELFAAQAIALPFDIGETPMENWIQTPVLSSSLKMGDSLDQSQPDMDWFGPVGPCPLVSGVPNYILAQSFIPTLNVLTRVELMIGRNSTTTFDYTIAIRGSLDGPNLASASIPALEVTTENFSWEEFDFPDILVTPGHPYYIVSWTVNATDNWYAWGLKMESNYTVGTVYYSIDDEKTWILIEEPDADMTFKTYGINNQPPGSPIIDGETSGKVGQPYTYTFVSVDPDDDAVYYCIDWGDGTPEEVIGPYESGLETTAEHTWSVKGTYIIKAKAEDNYGSESDWASLTIVMPYSYNMPFIPFLVRFFERFPHAFPTLRNLMGY